MKWTPGYFTFLTSNIYGQYFSDDAPRLDDGLTDDSISF